MTMHNRYDAIDRQRIVDRAAQFGLTANLATCSLSSKDKHVFVATNLGELESFLQGLNYATDKEQARFRKALIYCRSNSVAPLDGTERKGYHRALRNINETYIENA